MEFYISDYNNGIQKIPINNNKRKKNNYFSFTKGDITKVNKSQKIQQKNQEMKLNNNKDTEVEEEEEEINSDEYISS